MKDIDFDELDKAVNSLMGTVKPDSSDSEDGTPAKTLTISGTLKPGEEPSYTKLEQVAKTIGNETLTLAGERTVVEDLHASLPADGTPPELPIQSADVHHQPTKPSAPKAPRPSNGRFMDVIHSSSSVKSSAESSTPKLTVPERTAPTPAVQASVPPSVLDTPKEQAAPAPIEVSAPLPEADPTPLTPFLPDAKEKVEKRPLGAVSSTNSDDDKESDLEFEGTSKLNARDPKGHTDTQAVLDATNYESEEVTEHQKLQEIESQVLANAANDPSVRAVESADTGALKESPKVNDKTPSSDEGAIYDVGSLPQPLSHPVKQKSGWGVVVIIVVIILLSAALGAAAYFILGLGA